MAVQFKTSGTILFAPAGSVAMDAACCCGECVACCEGIADKTLFLTLGNLTLDGGETCDDGCLPDIIAEASTDTGGGETACGAVSANWLVAPVGAGTAELSTIQCDEAGNWEYANQGTLVLDGGGGTVCQILLDPNPQTLPGVVCDPFYWEGDLDVIVNDAGETPCGTGTIHVIISE